MDDKELMQNYQMGDLDAFNELYKRHKGKVYAYLKKRLPHSDQVDDLYQKVFVKFHKSRNLYQPKFDVLPWLYTIARSELLDSLKKKSIDTSTYNDHLHALPELKEDVNSLDIEAEPSLSRNEKLALTQRYYQDKDFDEIALILQTSESNVRKIISRAIQKLKKKYKGAKL